MTLHIDKGEKLTTQEIKRYSRHLVLPEFGMRGQLSLRESSVLVVGAGGLGCPLLSYIAAAGIGRIGIVDFDVVDESNLQRQVLYTVDDIGKPKAECAARRLRAMNPHIEVVVHPVRLTAENALEIVRQYDIVADGADNFPTRYLVNDACLLTGKPNVYAAIYRFDGQVSVFNHIGADGVAGPNYRDLYPEPPPPGSVPSCAEGGVLGVLPGIIGSIQANEVLKLAAGIGEPLAGRLFVMDLFSFEARILKFKPDPQRPRVEGLIDYELFCGMKPAGEEPKPAEKANDMSDANILKEITVQQLKEMQDGNTDFQLIDVREPFEYEIVNLGGELIPLAEVVLDEAKINREKMVVIHCRSGGRSANAIKVLQERYGFDNLYNLKGGVLAYAQEIDQSLPQY